MELSNNRAERSIKSYVIDRKNFLFANTPIGATGSAIMFSLIMTALEKKLDPWQYLTWLIKNYDTAKDVEQLLPWNAPDDCKIQRFSLPPCRLRQVFLYAFRFDAYRITR